MPSITNVNDLPLEVHKAFFDHFNPVERTLILSTCRRWYDLIMETRAWWREVKVVEGDSKEKMMRILQVFDQRSQGSLIKVQVNRRIETKEELQEILSSIEPSIGSIKNLILRQNSHLNTQTRTFARRLPQLRNLNTLGIPMEGDVLVAGAGLRVLETALLDDFQEQEEINWLFRLETLNIVEVHSEKTLWSVLNSCRASLVHLQLGDFTIQEGQEFRSGRPIEMEALKELQILGPTVSTLALPLIAPALRHFRGTFSQAEMMKSPSLSFMTLFLEDEEEEDEEQADEFVERYKSVFRQKPDLSYLAVERTSYSNVQLQLQCILQALQISDENEKEVPLPNLLKLHIKGFADKLDLKALASLAISRIKYFFNENSLNQNSLRARGIKIDMDILDEKCGHLISTIFKLDLDPVDPNLKDKMMEQYLKMKESMYDDWIKELKLGGSGSELYEQ